MGLSWQQLAIKYKISVGSIGYILKNKTYKESSDDS